MDKFLRLLQNTLNKEKSDEGFSLLELVVAVGVVLVLTITGLVSYNGMVNNARDTQVNNIAADLFMMGSTHRSAGKDKSVDSVTLEEWAVQSNMTFTKDTTNNCEIYNSAIKGEALDIKYSVDRNNSIKVKVSNTSNGYTVERQEPGFDNSCEI